MRVFEHDAHVDDGLLPLLHDSRAALTVVLGRNRAQECDDARTVHERQPDEDRA